ncbi:large ribosomal subunit protein mL49 [Rhineura floridana]|uniref:large ribosomal subunit protein mL49 n=1 Tax=Rhineura floridana TaxID=261503 RepID=UPI002AC80DBB|nr:large ribosomal subunit protein mL49 [Rhineura floridana]
MVSRACRALRDPRISMVVGPRDAISLRCFVLCHRRSKMAASVFAVARAGLKKGHLLPLLRLGGGRRQRPLGAAHTRQTSGEPSAACQKYPGIVESTDEYTFVERLIPLTQVPVPPKYDRYPTPSGWRPSQDPPPDLPYFVRRSRMHNIPVYTDTTHGCRKMTVIRKIEGNIWALENEVKAFLTQLSGQTPLTQVNELACSIRIKGYFDQELKNWLMDKGF